MAHMIDQTTGKDAIAYIGKTPWHGLGQKLSPGAPIETWRIEAGLNYTVERADVRYTGADGSDLTFDERQVLYRSDTGAPLSVVSGNYKIVQPSEVLDFFARLAEIGGFELETAGVLSGGQRIWGLAKVNDGAPIVGQDVVRPYVLLATSFDGTLATTAKFTSIRVVCHNTLTMAAPASEEESANQVRSTVKVPHNAVFKPESVRRTLGIAADQFERWLINTRVLADKGFSVDQADVFTQRLCSSTDLNQQKIVDVRGTKAYRTIMGIFSDHGAMVGGDLTGGQNRWRMLNAVTQYIDHQRGWQQNSRLSGAWFGSGDAVKSKAYDMLCSNESFQGLKAAA